MHCRYSSDGEYKLLERLTITIPPDFFKHIDAVFGVVKKGDSKKQWSSIREQIIGAFALLEKGFKISGKKDPSRWRKEVLAARIVTYLEGHLSERLTLDKMAKDMVISPSYLEEIFREFMGITPFEYLVKVRLNKALVLMRNPGLTIAEISYQVGYEDPLYFSKLFKKFTGYSPRNYRDTFIIEGKNPFSA
jgi:YesN/AraC family two-component response regulator